MTPRRLLLAPLLFLLALLGPLVQAAELTVGGFVLVSSRRISAAQMEFVYRATVTNPGAAMNGVAATAVSTSPATLLVKSTLAFGDVPANATVPSLDTITVRQASTAAFDPARLKWSVTGKVASPFNADFTMSPAAGDAPLTVRFAPAQVAAAVVEKFEWDLTGDGVVDITDTVGRNQSRTYSAPGSYAISLKITDAAGRSDTRVRLLTVGNAAPAVNGSASPSNGPVPLVVNFSANASDNDGITRFEWDFEGDGTWDRVINGTSGSTSFTYPAVGNYAARVRVTDARGASTVYAAPTLQVFARPAGSPRVTMSLSPSSGSAPLAVRLSASATPGTAQRYEWDTNGDGVFDSTTTTGSLDTTYAAGGTFYPRVRVTMADGTLSEDAESVIVRSTVGLSLGTDTIDAALAGTATVTTTLTATTRMSVVIERRGGGVVRTLVPMTTRAAGTYRDDWNGKNDAGQFVVEGIYLAVLLYEENGVVQRYDLAASTGGGEFNPSRTNLPSTFAPFDGAPLTVDFTLEFAAEVTAFVGSYNVNSRYTTFFTRQPFGRGTHRILWNGENTEGQLIKPAPGDSFLWGLFGYRLPNNGIFVRNSAQLTALSAGPPIYDPTGISAAGTANRNAIQFTLSAAASVELAVQDSTSGIVVNRIRFDNLAAGANTVYWDGKARDGRYVAPGTYRLGLTAVQTNGFRSLTSYTLQRVFF